MKALLTSDKQRHLELLEHLFYNHQTLTLKDLSVALNCSVRTITRDVNYLNLTYDPLKITASQQGLTLTYPKTLSIDYALKKTLSLSSLHRFIELLFLTPTLSTDQLTEKLFFSPSTLKRVLTKSRQQLAPFEIAIQTKPYRLSGNPRNIQLLFMTYFKAKTPNALDLFSPSQSLAISHLAHLLAPYLEKQALTYYLEDLPYAVLVASHTYQTRPTTKKTYLAPRIWDELKSCPQLRADLKAAFNLAFSQNFLADIIDCLVLKPCDKEPFNAFSFQPKPSIPWQKFRPFLALIANYFEEPFVTAKLLKTDLAHAIQSKFGYALITCPAPNFELHHQGNHEFQAFSQFLRQICHSTKFQWLAPLEQELLHIFDLHWPLLTIKKKADFYPIKIGLLTLTELPSQGLLIERLKTYLGANYHIVTINELESTTTDLTTTFDLLITTYSRLDLDHPHVLCLNVFPHYHEWQRLKQTINTLITQKNMT